MYWNYFDDNFMEFAAAAVASCFDPDCSSASFSTDDWLSRTLIYRSLPLCQKDEAAAMHLWLSGWRRRQTRLMSDVNTCCESRLNGHMEWHNPFRWWPDSRRKEFHCCSRITLDRSSWFFPHWELNQLTLWSADFRSFPSSLSLLLSREPAKHIWRQAEAKMKLPGRCREANLHRKNQKQQQE